MSKKLPVLFLSHGSPMNVVLNNDYTKSLKDLGKKLEEPKAIMIISAHWKTKGTYLTYSDKPKQIFDFYGFPKELYNVKYNPNGGKQYAELVAKELSNNGAALTEEWGLDHAAWGLLKYIYPDANIPTFEMSLNGLLNEEEHYKIGKKLTKFREMGILIIASGNIVHNLREMNYDMYSEPFDWATKFDNYILEAIKNDDNESLINYKKFGKEAKLSVPTDEHYLPLLYIAGLQEENDNVEVLHESIQHGSISMSCIRIG